MIPAIGSKGGARGRGEVLLPLTPIAARIAVSSPSPACGGGLGWGCLCETDRRVDRAPPTRRALRARRPPPQAGEVGERRACFANTTSHSRGAMRPEFFISLSLLK